MFEIENLKENSDILIELIEKNRNKNKSPKFRCYIEEKDILKKMLKSITTKSAKDALQNHKYKAYGAYFKHEITKNVFPALEKLINDNINDKNQSQLLLTLIKRQV